MRKSEKNKAHGAGNKLTKNQSFKRYALYPMPFYPMLYHSAFRLPTSEFQILSSDICFLSSEPSEALFWIIQ
jgi:hypothetical protein